MATPVHRSMTGLEWAILLTLSVLWGGSFFFIGVAVEELPPFTIVAIRVAVAALVLHGVVRLMGGAPPAAATGRWLDFLWLGLLNNALPFSLIVWGQTQIGSSLASILNATTPLFTVLVAHALTKDERLSGGRLAGVLIGFLGVAVMIGGAALESLGTAVLAQVACLGASVSYAFAGVYGKRFRAIPPLTIATRQLTASALVLLPVMLLVDRPWTLPLPSPAAGAAVMALAVLSTAVAYILFFRLLATAGAVNLALVTFLIPVTAILLGVLVLGETLAARHLAGMALIGLGLAAIDGRVARVLGRLRKPRPRDTAATAPLDLR